MEWINALTEVEQAFLAWGSVSKRTPYMERFEHLVRVRAMAAESVSTRVEALIEERTQAKNSRNFQRADEIRKDLAEQGIILQDTKDGVRWMLR